MTTKSRALQLLVLRMPEFATCIGSASRLGLLVRFAVRRTVVTVATLAVFVRCVKGKIIISISHYKDIKCCMNSAAIVVRSIMNYEQLKRGHYPCPYYSIKSTHFILLPHLDLYYYPGHILPNKINDLI
jgi:hypothetical protein